MGEHRKYIDRINLCMNQIDGLYYMAARKMGIKDNTLILFYVLNDRKPHTQKEICEEWLIPRTTINTIVRENVKEGLKTILQGINQIKNGISVWIFPEGTRNESENVLELLPFKEGSLKMAEKSGCPVVPVAMTGTAEVFERHLPFIRPSHVIIEFGKPFIIKELEPEYRKFPGAYTEMRIKQMLSAQLEERKRA